MDHSKSAAKLSSSASFLLGCARILSTQSLENPKIDKQPLFFQKQAANHYT
ncbi:hypothetical protein MJO28_007578 [Puccinia striiformis f. sp. tritici]|uniref:Uncharacterized protein n=1 Tax=Puccinia striiformis f. sp. tritici TaxID=168172 RepID=A0ACC0EEV2_9BASI|nr:hypothetical protein MJO28_007578 [Puccinia striiformis f. sp. tritici]KAI7956118.1 hypothetical protein MJO29_007517 [Puccinia striiformis f. sp. tritici]